MIFILLYQIFAGLLAWFNYWLIENNYFKNIYHSLNAVLHITAAVLIGYFTDWNYGVSCLLFTRVVFDTVLNVFRHKGVGYVSPAPASVMDKIEKKFILWVAGIRKVFITENRVQWVAIVFRIFILGLATTFLII